MHADHLFYPSFETSGPLLLLTLCQQTSGEWTLLNASVKIARENGRLNFNLWGKKHTKRDILLLAVLCVMYLSLDIVRKRVTVLVCSVDV